MAGSLVVEKKKRDPYWITYIKRRIKNKKNFLCFISGPTGSGKSWSALRIALMLDKNFGKDRIIMSMKELMRLINSKKLKGAGAVILWDEAGVDLSSKNWQSLTNKLINFLMQTFRHQRIILLFTSPYLDYIDASTRKLFHAEWTMTSINFKEGTAKIKPHLIQYNSRLKKFYYKYLRVRTLNRGVAPVKFWNIPKPPNWLIEQYEELKLKFTGQLNINIEKQLNELERSKIKTRTPLTDIQFKVLSLMSKYDDIYTVSMELNISVRTAYFHISQSKKKNWHISDFGGENDENKGT